MMKTLLGRVTAATLGLSLFLTGCHIDVAPPIGTDNAHDRSNGRLSATLSPTVGEWRESATRPAGTRQTLKIDDTEYGFCWIPAGEFDMGSPEEEEERCDVEVLHHVKLLRGFWILETPVTQKLYRQTMGKNESRFQGDDLPAEHMSYEDAREFCKKLTSALPSGVTAQLPTEAQWEYACRAGTTTPYSFGSVLNGDKANCDGTCPYGDAEKGVSIGRTTPVKTYDPNPWGVYDMHGNVFEWVLDLYGDYPAHEVVDPQGAVGERYAVCRGGSWKSNARACRAAFRDWCGFYYRSDNIGFRIVIVCD